MFIIWNPFKYTQIMMTISEWITVATLLFIIVNRVKKKTTIFIHTRFMPNSNYLNLFEILIRSYVFDGMVQTQMLNAAYLFSNGINKRLSLLLHCFVRFFFRHLSIIIAESSFQAEVHNWFCHKVSQLFVQNVSTKLSKHLILKQLIFTPILYWWKWLFRLLLATGNHF